MAYDEKGRTLPERFWAKVQKTNSCWLWIDSLSKDGYGSMSVANHKTYAHRIAYELVVGSIPDGMTIDHLCRNRACVNPSHLEAVSNRENLLRGNTIPAKNAAKTQCPLGHPYDEENTGLDKGRRYCKACKRIRARALYRAKRGANPDVAA